MKATNISSMKSNIRETKVRALSKSRQHSGKATAWDAQVRRGTENEVTPPPRQNELSRTELSTTLSEQLHHAQTMLDYVCDAVMSTDTETNITYMNCAAENLTGFTRQEAIGRPLRDVLQVLDINTRQPRKDLARHVMETNCTIGLHNGALMINRNGLELAIEDSATPLHNTRNEVVGALVMFHDARYSSETTARMTYLAQHDALTGLLNRHAFSERFQQAAALAQRHQNKMMLLFIDLDDFKEVNDSLGHTRGDVILKTLGQKLMECVRATDHVCRYGGDEFVVLLSDIEEPEQAFSVVDKVRDAAADLLQLGGRDVSIKLSIGVSVYPDDGDSLDVLLPHADAAMYRVKASNKRQHPEPNPTNVG